MISIILSLYTMSHDVDLTDGIAYIGAPGVNRVYIFEVDYLGRWIQKDIIYAPKMSKRFGK